MGSIEKGDLVEITNQYIIRLLGNNLIAVSPIDNYEILLNMLPIDGQWKLELYQYNQFHIFTTNPNIPRTNNKVMVNDYIDTTSNYIIRQIWSDEILISPIDNLDIILKLLPINNKWQLETQPYNQLLEFKKQTIRPVDKQIILQAEKLNNLHNTSVINNAEIYSEYLPDDIFFEIAVKSDLQAIKNLCRSSSHYNNLICNNQAFWRNKFKHDYGFLPDYIRDWKKLYKTYGLYQIYKTSTTLLRKKVKKVSYSLHNLFIIDVNNNLYGTENSLNTELNVFSRFSSIILLNTNIQPNPLEKAKDVSTNIDHTLYIDINDNLFASGDNTAGELGLGHNFKSELPQSVGIKAKMISAGRGFSLVIDDQNNLLSFGINEYIGTPIHNILGLGSNIEYKKYQSKYKYIDIPTNIINPESGLPLKAKEISAGLSHSLIIDKYDYVWSIGSNGNNQRGIINDLDIPTRIKDQYGNNIKAKYIYADRYSSFIIDQNNNILILGQITLLNNYIYFDTLTNYFNIKAKQINPASYGYYIIDMDDNLKIIKSNSIIEPVDSFKATKIYQGYAIGYPGQDQQKK